MMFRQYLHRHPVIAASYVFGCGSRRAGCVVDPVESPDFYLREALALGLDITCVIDTHVHADHVSTGRALAEAAHSTYGLHEGVDAGFDFQPLRDGDRLELGNTKIDVLHVPGHTPEHIALLVTDHARGLEPWFILTGHTLMVGDLGRTELATSFEEGARALYESAQRLKQLPDHIEVYPGAFAGSVCGRGLNGKAVSTIGFERRFNKAFAIEHRDAFMRYMATNIPLPPANAAENRAQNLGMLLVTA